MSEFQEILQWGLVTFKVLAGFGPLGAASLCLMLAIRFYQTESIQQMLPARMRWSNLSQLAKLLIPVGGSLLAALLAMLGGASASLILPFVGVVAVGSIAGHHATKALGSAMYNAEVKKNPFYEPSPFRALSSIVVPLPKIQDLLHDNTP